MKDNKVTEPTQHERLVMQHWDVIHDCKTKGKKIPSYTEFLEELIASRDSRTLSAVPSEEKLASLADCINQELRESNGDEFQIKNIYEDYRPAIKKLVDLNRARGIAG